MKHTVKKLPYLLISSLLLCLLSMAALAEGQTTMSISLRIEGIKDTVFYKTVAIPYEESLTLQSALIYVDAQEDSLTITGIDKNYITEVNGEAAGQFGGYDGWLYRVNNTEPSTGIDSYMLKNGDCVVLYYGDPFGVGMQYPVVDSSKIDEGTLKFTSSDTTYDADFNPTVTVNPIVGATVTWKYGDNSAVYTTDANGEIQIDAAQLTAEKHSIQISKVNDKGIPLVLRLASDEMVEVKTAVLPEKDETAATTTIETTKSATTTADTDKNTAETAVENPQTGDNNSIQIVVMLGIVSVLSAATMYKGRKHLYEN